MKTKLDKNGARLLLREEELAGKICLAEDLLLEKGLKGDNLRVSGVKVGGVGRGQSRT